MLHFCTYFDHRYLARALALHQSLKRVCPPFQLWTLCMDTPSFDLLSKYAPPEIRPIALDTLERSHPELLEVKKSRSPVEYYFTCSPFLPYYILSTEPEVDLLTYLDADLFFYSDPAPLFEEMGKGSIGIIGHRFPPHLKGLEAYGIYNVGWLSFRKDERALECLRWWSARCMEWCYDRPEPNRFADQKYLDDWPSRFDGVVVLQHKGANVAPWNVGGSNLNMDGTAPLVDGDPLLFFHFHGLKHLAGRIYDPQLGRYHLHLNHGPLRALYRNYIRALQEAARQAPLEAHTQALSASARGQADLSTVSAGSGGVSLPVALKTLLRHAKGVLAGDLILVR
ncbi:MAG: glycosyl transferase [Nitrospirae bacterium]|nr:glycosyl transferase [Nitrospirota bacterium]